MSSRGDVLCMMRIKNEARWIRRSLERTWTVCQTVVIFDDHSTDQSFSEAVASCGASVNYDHRRTGGVTIRTPDHELHWLLSPFQETVDEVRDKNHLWDYVSELKFRHVLCLDGDEMLSRQAIKHFSSAVDQLEHGGAGVIVMPFIYLWDDERFRRIDGVYNDIRHARMFTIDRAPNYKSVRFFSRGRAGFHCGSIPDPLSIHHRDMPNMPVIHFGYLDDALRRRKLDFYNALDPGNEGEGYYRHIVGEANHLAPGPVRLVEYLDQ